MATPNNKGKKYNRRAADPRQATFKKYWIDPKSPSFMNVLQSALRAGYSQEYSESLGCKKVQWFEDLMGDSEVRRARLLGKAERALENVVDYNDDNGNNKDLAALKLKAASFVAERVGKDHYSTRQELTDKGGKRLFTNHTKTDAEHELNNLFAGVESEDSKS